MAEKQKKRKESDRNLERDAEIAVHTTFRAFKGIISAVLSVFLTVLIVGAVAGCIVVCAFAVYIANNVDFSVDDIVLVAGSNTEFTTRICYYDKEGNLVEDESQRLSSGGNSYWVSYDEIPENLVNAFVAIEDKRFWDHNGVDTITTLKAVANYFLPTGNSAGGSTITQQLVKNVTGNDDYTIQRKVQEIFKAMELEKELDDKTKIMETYLNIICLSQGANGVQEAAHVYFNKNVQDLSLLECAAIAGITQSPTKWDPVINPDNNKARRNTILTEMYNQGLITKSEYDEAYDAPLELDQSKSKVVSGGTNSWYTDAVINDATELLAEHYNVTPAFASQMLYSGGYTIVTAIDHDVQAVLDKYYTDLSKNSILPVSNVTNVESAMIVLDPHTSNVLAMVGGRGEKTENRIFNLATQAKRQPGSSFKPVAVYAPAIESGVIHYGSVIDDIPYNFGNVSYDSDGKAVYSKPTGWPQNSSRTYGGLTTLENAIAASKNTIAVWTLSMLGIDNSFDFLTNKVGISTLVDTDKNLASLGLGGLTYGVTLEELTGAYSIFTNHGVYTRPRTILEIRGGDGEVLIDNQPKSQVVLSEGNSQVMVRLLESVTHNSNGTAVGSLRPIAGVVDVAGKTGTTNKDFDKWFVGFTPYYLAGVWTGYLEPQKLTGIISAQHLKIWNQIMMDLHAEFVERDKNGEEPLLTFDDDLLIKANFCKDSGMLIGDACEADPRGNRSAVGYFTKETLPSKECDQHVFVRYCRGHGVAGPNCPASECTYVGLVRIDPNRSFPRNIYVTDAQYTYTELGGSRPWTNTVYQPFYWNVYRDKNLYPGMCSVDRAYNRYCTVHN